MRGVLNTEGKRVIRREVLRAGALLAGGIGAAALLGCGEDDDAPSEPGATTSPTAGASAADIDGDGRFPYNVAEAAGEPKRGGTLVQAASWNVGPMDPTKSAAGGTIGPGRAPTTAYCVS